MGAGFAKHGITATSAKPTGHLQKLGCQRNRKESTGRTTMTELWLGYVAGALTFGWLLPWIGRKIK